MKKNIFKIFVILSVAFAVNCKNEKKDDSTTTMALLFLADQMSGHCATVSKSTTSTGLYTAFITPFPKGKCKITTTLAEYTTNFNESNETKAKVYDKHTACSALATSTRSATVPSTVTDATLAEAAKNQRAYGIGNGYTEGLAMLKAAYGTTFTAAALENGRMATVDEFFTLNAYFSAAFSGTANATCATAIKDGNKTLMDNAGFNGSTNVTAYVAYLTSCYYGSNAMVTDKNKCASLSEAF